MPNALAQETSPYLLQHRDNPVDWLPWGEAALSRARDEDRPLLVSIGYSACHWCHVMERECFEDERIAALMNEHFVCVKVDREERPDVDALYMDAVQAMTGQGGWPLNVFLTPEQVPFFGGTYFPPEAAHGDAELASGPSVCGRGVGRAPRRDQGTAGASSSTCAEQRCSRRRRPRSRGGPRRGGRGAVGGLRQPPRRLRRRAQVPARLGDRVPAGARAGRAGRGTLRGAWRSARCARWRAAGSSTRSAAASPATPSTPPGRSRTSRRCSTTTPCWRAPTCTAGSSAARSGCCEPHARPWTGRCARCAAPEGGFYAALDADSEGVEGRYYVWTVAELREVLGEDAEAAIAYFGATGAGQLRGRQRARGARRGARARAARIDPRAPAGRARGAGAARPRRQAPDGLERADDRRAGRRRRGAGRERRRCYTRRQPLPARRRPPPGSCWTGCATPTGACCAASRTTAPTSRPTSRTTPSCSRRCWRSTRRRSTSAGSPGAGSRRHDPRALRRPRARRLLLDRLRPRGAGRPPQGSRGPPHSRGGVQRGARPAAPRRPDRRARLRARGRAGAAALT